MGPQHGGGSMSEEGEGPLSQQQECVLCWCWRCLSSPEAQMGPPWVNLWCLQVEDL